MLETNEINLNELDLVEKRAAEMLEKYHGCAQCILMAIQEVYGQQDSGLAKSSALLNGGIAGTGSVCGALTGAILAMGMKYGRDPSALDNKPEDPNSPMSGMAAAGKLVKWFQREFDTTLCSEIRRNHLGIELSREIPWEADAIDKLGMRERCRFVVCKTARHALALMRNPALGFLEEI